MNLGSRGKKDYTLFDAFRSAFSGIIFSFKTERNMRIHLLAAIIVIVSGFFFSITNVEWMVLILVIAITIALELINTAIENAVDLITAQEHPVAKAAKDIAAGAVLIFCIASVGIGLIIFIPRIIERFFM